MSGDVVGSSLQADDDPPGQNWKLILTYDGGPFAGWQVQPGLSTVQGQLAATLARVTGEQVLPQGSGRTDTGVHALGQVASFMLRAPIPPDSLRRALNNRLPASIRVLHAEHAPPGFHARHSARSKFYEYRIWRAELCPPWLAPYVYACPWPLAVSAMQEAAALVLGEHDFTSFAARQPDQVARGHRPPRPGRTRLPLPGQQERAPAPTIPIRVGPVGGVRELLASSWTQPEPDLLCYRVRGSGFLHHMVRNLVGTFLAVGRGHVRPSDIPEILAARNRSAAGSTAPARGLYLVAVGY